MTEVTDDGDLKSVEITRIMFNEAFDVNLKDSRPPEEAVEAVQDCLGKLSLCIGGLATLDPLFRVAASSSNYVSASGAFSSSLQGGHRRIRKRGSSDDEDDDPQSNGGSHGGSDKDFNAQQDKKRARPEVKEFSCPFRKRNPLRFNCREYEYCAKAPFESISNLK
jgi:hypothetical protein